MRRLCGRLFLSLSLFAALFSIEGHAFGQSAEIEEAVTVVPTISAELLDPLGLTRFHLVTRANFFDYANSAAFERDVATWSFEARAHVRITRGLALAAVLPFGLLLPGPGRENRFFFGNFSLGVGGGTRWFVGGPGLSISIGGGLDLYAPTAPESTPDDLLPIATGLGFATPQILVASMRAYEPQLYLPDLMSFRARMLARIQASIFTGELELGLVPGFTVASQSDFVMFFGVAARLSVQPSEHLEPYVEMGVTTQVAGPSDLSPPFLVTPGLRFHIAESFDPAIFISFNFVEASSIIFGVDLAGALRPGRRAANNDIEDFFGGF
jgi:hypothetical protein